jgi:selenide,water dikinase
MGIMPGGLHRNKKFRINMVTRESSCPDWLFDVLFDPQTSGGLIISLPSHDADALLEEMKRAGIEGAAKIGRIVRELKGKISVT